MSPSHSTHSMSPNLNNNQHPHRGTPDVESHAAIFPTPPNSSLAPHHQNSPSSNSSSNNNQTSAGIPISQASNSEFTNSLHALQNHSQSMGTSTGESNQGSSSEGSSALDSSATTMLRSALTIGLDRGDHSRTDGEQHLVNSLDYKEDEVKPERTNTGNFDLDGMEAFDEIPSMMPNEPIQKVKIHLNINIA